MNAPFDVTVVGNVGIDTNIYLQGADIDFNVEANFTENIDYVGQAGGYAARGYTRLGKKTAFIGYVGDDFCGQFIRAEFAQDHIDSTALFTDPGGSSRSINIMYRDGRRKNFYDGKSHMHLQPDLAACQAVLQGCRLAHFNIPNWARQLLPIARQAGAVIACDLQDITHPDDPYRQDFIYAADILFFSATNFPDPTPLIEAYLRRKPSQIIVCGMGAQGCALGSQQGIQFFPPFQMPAPVIDTNGAGDSLAVGFLTSYILEGRALPDSIQRGQIAARYTCTLKAASNNLIDQETMNHYART